MKAIDRDAVDMLSRIMKQDGVDMGSAIADAERKIQQGKDGSGVQANFIKQVLSVANHIALENETGKQVERTSGQCLMQAIRDKKKDDADPHLEQSPNYHLLLQQQESELQKQVIKDELNRKSKGK